MLNIVKVLKGMKIDSSDYELYQDDKAKIKLSYLENKKDKEDGRLILVTAMTPTALGEGKTTVSIGLADGLNRLGKDAVLALREPSLGPVFGLKGGAVGGGKSTLIPEDDINFHFTGDFHAVVATHNLLSALVDAHIYHGNELDIQTVVWKRTLDINDRSLRQIGTSLRSDGFIIAAASEIMAVIALASSFLDLKKRLERILIGYDGSGRPIHVKNLGCVDSLAILLKDAIKPNVVQTLEGTPAFVHMGPFANVAHGCNSVLATKMALKSAKYVITEAGFGSDLGAEKFFNIKMPYLGKAVDVVVIVVTLRALKTHGFATDAEITGSSSAAVLRGIPNLERHIENITQCNLKYVLALNYFASDSQAEVNAISNWAYENKHPFEVIRSYQHGSLGATDLAKKVIKVAKRGGNYSSIYDKSLDIKTKITTIAQKVYGAGNVIFTAKANAQIDRYEVLGWNKTPICMAKTPQSLTGDANLLGRPTKFDLVIDEVNPSLGAGFMVAQTAGIITMPGLGKYPRAYQMRIDDTGNIVHPNKTPQNQTLKKAE